MARPRKNKIGSAVQRPKGRHWLDCKICAYDGAYVAPDIASVICSDCVSKQVAPPAEKKKADDEKRPRGWHFMSEYISPSGKIYHRGVEVNESDPINQTVVHNSLNTEEKGKPTGRKRGRPRGSGSVSKVQTCQTGTGKNSKGTGKITVSGKGKRHS